MSKFSTVYLDYLNSSEWQRARLQALTRAKYRCQVCGERIWLQVHHVTYTNLGHEAEEDLTVLCWRCHWWVTWMLRARRFWCRLLIK